MNSIAKNAKQALSSLVVTATILWSMGASLIVAPLTAHAAPAEGSLIKAKEWDSVYYYKAGKRFTFPNLKTYKSWYKDFSTVKVIPSSELQTYSLQSPDGNVKYRAGTRLVKITTDPKVYAVTPSGVLRWVKDEATAKALYGNDWAKRVDDVPDAFFTNYSVGQDLSGSMLPDGSLVKSGSNWFYVEGGKKRAVSEAAFASNSFNAAYAISVADVSAYADGAALGATDVADVAQGVGPGSTTPPGGTTPPAASGALTVSLASDSPSGTQSLVADATEGGQRMAKMVKLNFAAAGGEVKVTQVTAKRTGVSKDADVDTLYLADANGKVLAKNTSFSNGNAVFSGALFTVPAGQTVSAWLLEDVNKSSAAGSTQGWTVEASGVKIEGSGAVTGSAAGQLFSVAVVTDLGQLEFATSTPLSAATVDAGKTNFTLGTFKFKAIDQEMLLKKVKFTQIGTIATTDLQNLKLQVAGIQYDATKQLGADNTITFDLTLDKDGKANADGGLKILAGQTKFTDIVGDIIGGTNRNFKFSIQNEEDLVAFDNQYKVNVATASWSTNAFAVETLAATSINTGTLTITVATGSVNGNVALNASGVSVAKFTFTASGEDMKVTSISATTTASDWTNIFKNVKLMLNGSQVGTTATSLTAGVANAYTFSNNFVVKVGKPATLEIITDLTDATLAANETMSFQLAAGSSNAQGLVSLSNVSTSAVSANTLTLKSGTPTVSKNTAVIDNTTINPTGVIKDTDLTIGSFVLTAGSGEGAKITSIGIQDNAAPLNGLFNRLRLQGLKDGKKVNLAPEVGTLSAASTTYTFALTEAIQISKGQQYVVDVVADVLSTTSSDNLTASAQAVVQVKDATVAYQTIETGQSGTIAVSGTTGVLQNVFIASKGTLVGAVSADTPVAQQVVMGATNQPLLKFKLTAGKSEDVSITELVTAATIMASSTVPSGVISNIRLFDGDAPIGSAVAGLVTSDASATTVTSTAYAKFPALNITIPKNTSKTYTVVADIATTPDTLSGENFTMWVVNGYDTTAAASNVQSVVAKGGKSGSTINPTGIIGAFPATGTTTVRGSVMTVYKTKLSVAHAANAPSGASSKGTDQVVAKFVISNGANKNSQAATISAMDLALSTSISQPAAGSARTLRIYKTEQLNSTNQVNSTSLDASITGSASATNYDKCLLGPNRTEAATGCPLFIRTTNTNSFTSNVIVEAGTSQTFTITLDTNDASANNTLTVGLAAGDIIWTDGYTASINSVDSLPLTGKTLTY